MFWPDYIDPANTPLPLILLAFLYLVIIERSDLRTVGFRRCGAR